MLFTRDFQHFLSLNGDIDTKYEDFYMILETIGINSCRENFLIEFFETHDVNLPMLKPNHIVDALIVNI